MSTPYKTNMSVGSCNFKPYNKAVTVFDKKIEPELTPGYTLLNPVSISRQYDRDFNQVPSCACPQDYPCSCKNDTSYIDRDRRMMDFFGEYIALDTPPLTGQPALADIYKTENDYRTGYYRDYSYVNQGDILYYVDGDIKDPFFQPNYENPAGVTGYVYRDPMNSYKNYYYRNPINRVDVYDTNRYDVNELSWIRDSQETREDLMSKQSDLMNRKKYTARWY